MATRQIAPPAREIPGTNPDDRLINEHEAASRLGLQVSTLRRWRWARRGLKWIKIGSAVRYAPSDIQAFIDAGRSASTAQAA